MIIGLLSYVVIFILLLQSISICCYLKKRSHKLFKRINYINDSRFVDDYDDNESEV